VVLLALSGCGGRAAHGPSASEDAGAVADAADGDAGPGLPLCAPFVACGGSLVGRWTIVSDCYESIVEKLGCESIHHVIPDTVAGTYEFSDAGTAVFEIASTVRYTDVIPDTCLKTPCDTLQASLETALAKGGGGTAVCSALAASCSCDVVSMRNETLSLPYSVVRSRLTILVDPNTNATTTLDFCVKGSELTLHSPGRGSMTLSRE